MRHVTLINGRVLGRKPSETQILITFSSEWKNCEQEFQSTRAFWQWTFCIKFSLILFDA